jgi:hypothetical protein
MMLVNELVKNCVLTNLKTLPFSHSLFVELCPEPVDSSLHFHYLFLRVPFFSKFTST